jgi:hypothetical protein
VLDIFHRYTHVAKQQVGWGCCATNPGPFGKIVNHSWSGANSDRSFLEAAKHWPQKAVSLIFS